MIAFLVLAHSEPNHLKKLVRRLLSNESAVFVHIDAKSDIGSFNEIKMLGAKLIPDRVNVYWSGWSVVQATLNLIRSALEYNVDFSHFILLSGLDYILIKPEVLKSYLLRSNIDHIDCIKMPEASVDKMLDRLEHFYFERALSPGILGKFYRRLNTISLSLPPRRVMKALNGLAPYGGSQWWILKRSSAIKAFSFSHSDSKAMKLFKSSRFSDEFYFQTILAGQNMGSKFRHSCTYTDWSAPRPPATINESHADLILRDDFLFDDIFGQGPCFFARKFPVGCTELMARFDTFADQRKAGSIAM
jgi:hypothetical protein